MTDYLLCCFYYKANQQHHSGKFAIRNIDKSMIGLPTNFQHCAHIGCSDVITTSSSPIRPNIMMPPLQQGYYLDAQMKSKAGLYSGSNSTNSSSSNSPTSSEPIVAHLKLIDLKIS